MAEVTPIDAERVRGPKIQKWPKGDSELDRALDRLANHLFNAEAIIASVTSSIESEIGDEIDKISSRIPNWPRALESARKLIQAAYEKMEMPSIREIADGIEKEKAEAEDN